MEQRKKKLKCEIYRDSMQNYKKYAIPPAQLIIADVPYNVGTNFYGKMEYQSLPVVIDENTLKKIASATGGTYFRATDKNTLSNIFAEIDRLEKTQMDVKQFSHTEDNYMPWAILLLILVCFEIVARNTILRNIP